MARLYTGTFSPFLRSYQDVKDMYNTFRQTERVTGRPFTDQDKREINRSARVVYRRPANDPLALPLSQAWRHVADVGGLDASGRDYRILPEDPADPWTDDELDDYVRESDVYCPFAAFSPSGHKVTTMWSYHRTPAGVVLIHYWQLDT